MTRTIIKEVPRIEGMLSLAATIGEEPSLIVSSARSTKLEGNLFSRYPLEAVTLTQRLSAYSGVSHGLASIMAIEDYLRIVPVEGAVILRQLVHKLSSLLAHLHHFYLEVLPDYLNEEHLKEELPLVKLYLPSLRPRPRQEGDLGPTEGKTALSHLPQMAKCLDRIQEVLVLFCGRYPFVPNLIPGGVSNSKISRAQVMTGIRLLAEVKPFVEEIWPEDAKNLIRSDEELGKVHQFNQGFLSVGNLETAVSQPGDYSPGVYHNDRLEPFEDDKVTESLASTYYEEKDKGAELLSANLDKPGAHTWTKAARYDQKIMQTGALSRMLVTHFGGGNVTISDSLLSWLSDLGLEADKANCGAARLLAEVHEGIFYLASALQILLEFDYQLPLQQKINPKFQDKGDGTGRIEGPAGTILHKIHVEDNQIMRYKITSAQSWNLSSFDELNQASIVQRELNDYKKNGTIDPLRALRILHGYFAQGLEGSR